MRPASDRIASLVATGLVVLVLAACSGAASAPSPTAGPSAAPSEVPSPVPSGAPVSPKPSDGGTDAMPITVDLKNVTGAKVSVDVVDRSGTLLKAVSGQPAEGASVDTNTIKIENIDPRTLRLTWTDFRSTTGWRCTSIRRVSASGSCSSSRSRPARPTPSGSTGSSS